MTRGAVHIARRLTSDSRELPTELSPRIFNLNQLKWTVSELYALQVFVLTFYSQNLLTLINQAQASKMAARGLRRRARIRKDKQTAVKVDGKMIARRPDKQYPCDACPTAYGISIGFTGKG